MAARYFINGGVNSNWSTSGNWSATDGGAASGVKPTSSDDVFFTANSPNCTVDTAGVGLTLNFTGYASTITMTAGLTISGSVTLVAAMTIAGTGGLIVGATSTLTSNTKVWPNALTIGTNTMTYTLADNWDVDGLLSIGVSGTSTINGFQITASAGLTKDIGSVSGTTTIVMDGTGTITHSTSAGALRNNLTINTAGTITFATTFAFLYDTGTFTYTAGTVVTTSSTLTVGVATTFACSGITWNNVTFQGTITCTFNENLNLTGLLTLANSTNSITLTGSTINAGGGVRFGGSSGTVSGTTVINVNSTSTLDAPSATTGGINNPITINAPGGTVTIAATFRILLNQLLYTAGTVTTSTGTWGAGGVSTTPSRKMRLFEGFKIKFISGRLIIQQR